MLFIATAIRSLKKLLDTHLGHVSNRQSINLSNSDGIKLAFRIFHEYFEKKEGRMKFGFKFVEKFHDCVIRITNENTKRLLNFMSVFKIQNSSLEGKSNFSKYHL